MQESCGGSTIQGLFSCLACVSGGGDDGNGGDGCGEKKNYV